MTKYLVTGAGGFIGSHMARRLSEEGNYVRAVDAKWDGYMEEPYYSDKLTLDLTKWENCLRVTKDIDYVYHFAANMGGIKFITEVGADIMHDNVLMNTHMLHAAQASGVRRLFYSSSACVYPTYRQTDARVTALREEDAYPADPDAFYGWEKLFTEKTCEAYKKDYGLDVRVVRYHNIYGPRGTYDGGREKSPAALCRKVARAADPGLIEIWGDGKQTRSYCHIDDCIRGSIMLMESDYDKPLNIGSDRLVSIDELADIITDISGKHIEREYDLSAPQGVRGRNADLTLVRQVLGWEPQVTLEQGLRDTYEWIEEEIRSEKPGRVISHAR